MTDSERKKKKQTPKPNPETELLWWGKRGRAEHLLLCCSAGSIALEAAVCFAFADLCVCFCFAIALGRREHSPSLTAQV